SIHCDHLEDDQLTAVLQAFLWIIIDRGKCHIAVFTVVDCVQYLKGMFYPVIILQSQDIIAKFVVDHRAASFLFLLRLYYSILGAKSIIIRDFIVCSIKNFQFVENIY